MTSRAIWRKEPWSKTTLDTNNSDVKSYEHCNTCGREWYAAENKIGFLTYPFCKQYSSISTRLDTTGGKMGLQAFDGAKYSTRPTTNTKVAQGSQGQAEQEQQPKVDRERKLKELNKVLSFTTGARVNVVGAG